MTMTLRSLSWRRGMILVLLLVLARGTAALGVGDAAPDWALRKPPGAGQIQYHSDSNGQVSVLLFWATWCPFCRTLMPHIQTIADEFRDQPVRFYALNVWEDADPVAYLEEHGFNFVLLLDAEQVAGAYGVRGTPGLFVVDQQHRVRYLRVSGEDDMDVEIALRETIAAAISPTRP